MARHNSGGNIKGWSDYWPDVHGFHLYGLKVWGVITAEREKKLAYPAGLLIGRIERRLCRMLDANARSSADAYVEALALQYEIDLHLMVLATIKSRSEGDE